MIELERSAAFYEQYLGLKRSDAGPPHAVVFDTKPIAFALRDLVPGVDLDVVPQPGIGAAIWLHATDVQAIHDAQVGQAADIKSIRESIDEMKASMKDMQSEVRALRPSLAVQPGLRPASP